MSVLESNAHGTPFVLDSLWRERQDRANALSLEAAARAARALADAADQPPMMVRVALRASVLLGELLPGRTVDGVLLQQGDAVLLTQQTLSSENGAWLVGSQAVRPAGYLNAPGRQFFVTDGTEQRGTMYVCTHAGTNTEFMPMLSRPELRDQTEEQMFVKGLVQGNGGVRASRICAPTTADDDTATKEYMEQLSLRASTAKRIQTDLNVDDDAFNREYIDALCVVAKKARILESSDTSDIDANASYIRNLVGSGERTSVNAVSVSPTTGLSIGSVLNGVLLQRGSRVLLSGQSDAMENGIYTVETDGALHRAPDMSPGSHCAGSHLFVQPSMRRFLNVNPYGLDVVGLHALQWQEVIWIRGMFSETKLYPGPDINSLRRTAHACVREPVLVVSLVNVTTSQALQVVDGVSVSHGARVLLVAQNDARQNGIWQVRSMGIPLTLRTVFLSLH